MANTATFLMKVKGKTENVNTFITIMQQENYEDGPHFNRIFDTFPTVTPDPDQPDHSIATIDGDCAWSATVCMMPGVSTYYSREDASPNSTHLIAESERLNLSIELYAEESGAGFEEHILIDNGQLLINDVRDDAQEHYPDDYETVEEFNEETGLSITEQQFINEESIRVGGFGNWKFQ